MDMVSKNVIHHLIYLLYGDPSQIANGDLILSFFPPFLTDCPSSLSAPLLVPILSPSLLSSMEVLFDVLLDTFWTSAESNAVIMLIGIIACPSTLFLHFALQMQFAQC
jgi:hypothetical protein